MRCFIFVRQTVTQVGLQPLRSSFTARPKFEGLRGLTHCPVRKFPRRGVIMVCGVAGHASPDYFFNIIRLAWALPFDVAESRSIQCSRTAPESHSLHPIKTATYCCVPFRKGCVLIWMLFFSLDILFASYDAPAKICRQRCSALLTLAVDVEDAMSKTLQIKKNTDRKSRQDTPTAVKQRNVTLNC